MNHLIQGYLDQTLTDSELIQLNDWLKQDTSHLVQFAEAVRLDNRLRDLFRRQQIVSSEVSIPTITSRDGKSRRWLTVGISFSVMIACVFVGIWWAFPMPLTAASELDRLIETSTALPDRSYIIHNLDAESEQATERRPPIDGAILHVRHPDQYVLIRVFADGSHFITGSDGQKSWSVPPKGAIRVSHDPQRFRGPLPGNQHGIPFVDLRSDLVELRDAYLLTVLPTDDQGRRGLLAVKKSPEYRGPNQVELRYDFTRGTIHRLVFNGLPRGRGGPNSVAMDLLEPQVLPANFFKHDSHHEPDQRVIEEE